MAVLCHRACANYIENASPSCYSRCVPLACVRVDHMATILILLAPCAATDVPSSVVTDRYRESYFLLKEADVYTRDVERSSEQTDFAVAGVGEDGWSVELNDEGY